MARKARTPSPTAAIKQKRRRTPIAEPFQVVSSATLRRDGKEIHVPMLVLYGEWLKGLGFPIGSAAYITTDAHGELALNRLGLGVPRRFRVRAMPR
jgi:hypothetical protein